MGAAPRAVADEIETAGDVLQYGVPAVGLAATAWLRDGTGFKQFVGTALVAETWVWTLKLVVDEKRPSGGGRGFPSGHSATAALGAGFVHRRYGLLPALPLYGLTGFVGWSRHDAGAHRTLDIVAGIAIGMGTAMVIGTPYEEELSVAPMLLRNGVGARLALRF
jgi:membrane-associated phospholipid phosphatase